MLRAHTEAINVTHHAGRIINTQGVFRGALIPAAIMLVLCAGVTWRMGVRAGAVREIASASRNERLTAATTVLLILGLFAAVTLGYLYAVEAAAGGWCGAGMVCDCAAGAERGDPDGCVARYHGSHRGAVRAADWRDGVYACSARFWNRSLG